MLRRAIAASLAVVLTVLAPGPQAWAAVAGTVRGRVAPLTPSLGGAGSAPLASPLSAPSLGVPSLAPSASLPAPSLAPKAAVGTPAAAAVPAGVPASALPSLQPASPAASALPAAPTPKAQAEQAGQLGGLAGPLFDGAKLSGPADSVPGSESAGAPVLKAPADLKLSASDEESVAQFTSDFHAKTAAKFADYGFTVRDYYAWARYLRFFTPSLGVKEALRTGAAYVYGDRFEGESERAAFDKDLADSVKALKLAAPEHGKDAKLAAELLKLAEPSQAAYDKDEASPFQIPLNALVPDKKRSALVLTPTTLRRIESAYRAFAMRDFALLLGPPATEKSAIPKYLAAENGIAHLAVTMHPGIGTFELVGGYRPKVVKLTDVESARRVAEGRLKEAEASGDFSELLESAAKVYGASLETALSGLRKDLAEPGSKDAVRRLLTLAHGLEFGASSLVWQDGYLTYALKRDIWITFEEINAAPTESQEFLNEFMRSRKLVVTQKLGSPEVLEPRAGGRFMLWATMNPETDPNREVLAQTLKNRWRVKYFGDLPSFEQAEIVEKVHGLPTTWALALVENVHKELARQARGRVIGDQWRDGYEVNLRHLMKVAKRWKRFVEQEAAEGRPADKQRQLFLLAREAYSVYGGLMRLDNEKAGVFVLLDQALKLSSIGVRSAEGLRTRPDRIEDLGDRIRIGDVELPKGPGGAYVPKPNADYLADGSSYERLYEYAKALAMGEPLLVMGESAAGKTTDLEYLFFRLDLNMRYKNLDSDTAIEEVIGGYATGKRRGEFVFREGLLPAAMEEGSGAFLDEFNLNPLVEWLNTVIDDGRLYLPERIVEGRPMLVAAANPPDPRYPGRILLSPATRSRYTELWAPRDESAGRLKGLMRHWLSGGTAMAMMLMAPVGGLLSGAGLGALGRAKTLSRVEAVPGRSRGEFDPGINWGMALLVVATIGFFAGALAGGVSGVIGLPMLVSPLIALALMSSHSSFKARMPLSPGNERFLRERAVAISLRRMTPVTASLRETPVGSAAERLRAQREVLGQVSSLDGEVLSLLADLAVAEPSQYNLLEIVKGLGGVGGAQAVTALEALRGRLKAEHSSFIDLALVAAREKTDAEAESQKALETAAVPSAAPDLQARAEAAIAALGASLPDTLRAAALREALAEYRAADEEAVAARRLEQLLSSEGTGLQALGGWLDRLKSLFGSKKKAPDAEDAAAPPTLESVLERVPEEQRAAMRAKAERVQTLMRMVGSSVGRDETLKWVPGDLWAFWPESNTATYPVEHLVTHTEEELVGVIDHESLHRETTVLDERDALVRKYREDPLKHFLWNGLEDPRVNSRGIHRLPGAERYLHSLYDRYLPKEGAQYVPGQQAPDVASLGDGATGFEKSAMQFPHIEFVMAANYYWRHGAKPKFLNKKAEEAFDKAKPDLDRIFAEYPRETEPSREQASSASMAALRDIDSKILPLYEPLVVESQKKLSKMMKGKGKGKGKQSGAGGAPQPGGEKQDAPKPDSKEGKEALKKLQDHARRAAEAMKGQLKDNPTKGEVEQAKQEAKERQAQATADQKPGDADPTPLTLEEIARTQRDQILSRTATPYQTAYQPVAHLSNPMVTHLENVFQKNARPKDVGYYRTGKRPDIKRAMKREGEGSARDDIMLRRAQATKRKYKVTLLVDESGSMDAFRREAIQAVVLFVDALSRLNIDVEVVGFSEKARVHKAFADPLTPANKDKLIAELQEYLGQGNTHDADALKLALERSLKEDADQRFVFVVTDGQGNGPSKLADVLPTAQKNGVQVLGVGVGDGMAYVRTAYPRHAVVPRIEDLPRALRDRLMESIARVELKQGSGPPAGAKALPTARGLHPLWTGIFLAASAWVGAVMTGVALFSKAVPAFLQPLPAAILLGSLFVFVPLKRWFPEAGPLGFATVVGALIAGVGLLPWYVLGGLALMLGLHYAAETAQWTQKRWGPQFPGLRRKLRAVLPAPMLGAPVVERLNEGVVGLRASRLEALRLMQAALNPGPGKPSYLQATLRKLLGSYERALELLAAEDLDAGVRAEAAAVLADLRGVKTEAEQAQAEVLGAPASPDLAVRAAAALGALEGRTDLASRLRAAALSEALRAYQDAEAETKAVAARRLESLLAEGQAGAQALGSSLSRGEKFVVGTAALAFVFYPLFSYGLSLLPFLAQPFVAGAVVIAILVLGTLKRESVLIVAYMSAGAWVLTLLGGWVAGAVMGGLLGFKGLYGALKKEWAPLPRDLEAQVQQARPQDPQALAWAKALAGLEGSRVKALRAMYGDSRARELETVVAALAAQDPSPVARSAASAVVGSLAQQRREAEAAKDEVLGPAPKADLEARAQAALSAAGTDLAGRLRAAALSEALAAWRAAPDAVTARRLEALLDENRGSGSGLLSRWKAPLKSLGRWEAAVLVGVPLFAAAQFALAWVPGALLFMAAAGVWMWTSWRWRDGSPLPLILFMSAMMPLMSLIHVPHWLLPWWATGFTAASALLAVSIHRVKARLLPYRLQLKLARLAPAPSALVDGLQGVAETRWRTLKVIASDAELLGDRALALFPMMERLAEEDRYPDIRKEAVAAFAAYLPRPEARAALERISKPKRYPDSAWAASTALFTEMTREAERAIEAQRKAAAQKAELAAVEERAEASLAAADASTLAGRLRRAALEEALAAYRASTGDERAVAERRLRDLLAEAAGSGSSALGRSALRLVDRPWVIATAFILAFNSAIFGVVAAFPSFFVPLGGVLMIGFIGLLILGKSRRSAIATFVLFSTALAVAGVKMGLPVLPFALMNALYFLIIMPRLDRVRGMLGFLSAPVESELRRAARGLALDAAQRGWAADLAGRRGPRLKALAAMKADPARSRALEPLLRVLWKSDDEAALQAAVEVAERWGDLPTLEWMAGWTYTQSGKPTAGARSAQEAADRLKAALDQSAELERLAQEASKAPVRDLGSEARRAIAALEGSPGLSERLRRGALEEALRAFELAPDSEASAVAARRLRELLDGASASGLNAAGSSLWRLPDGVRTLKGRFALPLSRKLRLLLAWDGIPFGLMQGSWVVGLALAPFIGSSALFVFAGMLIPGMLWIIARAFVPKSRAVAGNPEPLVHEEAFDAWARLTAAERAPFERLTAKASFGLPVAVDHPFLLLFSPLAGARRAAYQVMPRRPALAQALGAALRSRLRLRDKTVPAAGEWAPIPEDFEVLGALGSDGARELLQLLHEPVRGHSFAAELVAGLKLAAAAGLTPRQRESVEELSRAAWLPEAQRAELKALSELTGLQRLAAAPAGGLVERALARARAIAPGTNLPSQLRARAVAEEAAALSSAADEASRAAALSRLEMLLDAGAPSGARALGGPSPAVEALRLALERRLADRVRGWSVPHVEKPSFPYQVEKQRYAWQEKANEQILGNRRRIVEALTPHAVAALLTEVDLALKGPGAARTADDPAVVELRRVLVAAAEERWFLGTDGSLVNVGWGAGDHETASGWVPVGPKTASARLAQRAAKVLPAVEPGLAPAALVLDALERARERLRSLGDTLPEQLLKKALEEGVAAVEVSRASGDSEAEAVALRRLSDLLKGGTASGAGALGRVSALGWASIGSAALALVLCVGLALTALWALAPAAAAAAGGAAAALGWRSLSRPVAVSSRELYHAPRALAAVPDEFKPVVLALERLSRSLGAAAPNAALYKPEDAAEAHGGWNAVALGAKLSPDSAVGVGESWLTATRAELEGALGHELGHLFYGDNARVEAWKRSLKLALFSVPGAAGAALLLGTAWLWLVPAAALLLVGGSALLGLALHRAMERRADRFAAKVAGPEAAKAFLTRLASEAPGSGGGLLATHPRTEERLKAVTR